MPANPRVFLDIAIGTKAGGRVVFELFNDVAPRTVENFRGLCTGEYGTSSTSGLPLCFKGCKFFRVMPGFIAQSGDFECNNGEGGESIYGPSFSDESMLRRHCQAGVLAMANKGRNTNNSQFFVTLKKAPHLDGRHVVFGQVVQGMEVIRAIEKCPTDSNSTPRVPIVIVDCGQMNRMPGIRKDDPLLQMRDSVKTLMATLEPPTDDATATVMPAASVGFAQLENAVILKKAADALVKVKVPTATEESAAVCEWTTENFFEAAEAKPTFPAADLDFQNPREKRLAELRLRLNESRKQNATEVAAEARRNADPTLIQRENRRDIRNALDVETEVAEDGGVKRKKKPIRAQEGGWNLNEPASVIESKDEAARQKKKNIESAFGWNAMNVDAHYRAQEKRTAGLTFQPQEYAKQILKLGDHFYDPMSALVSAEFTPSEEAKERLASSAEKEKAQRRKFRRRRMYVEEETVQYINDFNRTFNRKLERAYGAQAAEIRQNLERGTAL